MSFVRKNKIDYFKARSCFPNWYGNCKFVVMKHILLYIIALFTIVSMSAQNVYHVFPNDHLTSPGTSLGDGSLVRPWDLQTALIQSSDIVNGGDTIWLHGGIYNGRFKSTIRSTIPNLFVTVASYPNEWAILNGNGSFKGANILTVQGNNVIYKDFEITSLGNVSRNEKDANFQRFGGVQHTIGGEDCQFLNLIIHNNPGVGFGSWRQTAGSTIANCIIHNNGFIDTKGKGRGEGMYVQNYSNKERIIKNNIIFNNYYKGIEVWSANKHAKVAYVKNITLDNNVIFNSGLPSGYRTVDNIIVASDDRDGINIATNIKVTNNILYHNTDFNSKKGSGDAASLTIGFHKNAPVENVLVDNNIIIGKNNALRILYAKSIKFTNNKVYSGYVNLNPSIFEHVNPESWTFNSNLYYTKNGRPFRVSKEKSYAFGQWKTAFNMDSKSSWGLLKTFNTENVLDVTKNDYKPNNFRVVLLEKDGNDVQVDFSEYDLQSGMIFTLRDVENYKEIVSTGILNDSHTINFPMKTTSQLPYKTADNFGVFIIEFSPPMSIEEQRDNFIKRFFKWMF